MQTIKKYSNRKLYHTNRKQYITLDGISALIRRGEQVRVIDNESGEDITAQILAQVALNSHDQRAPLPVSVLTGLIQAGNDTITGLRRSVATVISGGEEVDAEIERRLDDLLAANSVTADDHRRMLGLLVPHKHAASAEHRTLPIVPSANDIERLSAQIDVLSAAVEQLLAERGQGSGSRQEGLERRGQGSGQE